MPNTKHRRMSLSVKHIDDVLAGLPTYDKERYFHADHRLNLSRLAKSVLERKNGITLHELTLDIAQKHGLNRSSRKQRQHLRDVIKSWAGLWREGEEKTTVWLSPDDVCSEIPWRGLYAIGGGCVTKSRSVSHVLRLPLSRAIRSTGSSLNLRSVVVIARQQRLSRHGSIEFTKFD